MKGKITTIAVEEEIKKKLDELKVHPKEPYNDVIKRMIEKMQKEVKNE